MRLKLILPVLAALTLAACSGAHSLSDAERGTAELGAREYAERSGGKFTSCSGQDSDGDGYVTCSASLQPNTPPVEMLCGYKQSARGCKRKS